MGEALLTPTRIYVKPVLSAIEKGEVHGIAHITGGGFIENIPRVIPDGLCAKIDLKSIPTPPIFQILRRKGEIPLMEMYNIFNMGVGMAMVLPPDQVDGAVATLAENGQEAFPVGVIARGQEKVELLP